MTITNHMTLEDGAAEWLGAKLRNFFEETMKGRQNGHVIERILLAPCLALASALTTVAMRVGAVAESILKGLGNLLGAFLIFVPFVSLTAGMKHFTLRLPRNLLLLVTSPIEAVIKAREILRIAENTPTQRRMEHSGIEY
ncbi:MAG: hypothetical protein WB791_07390 [Waddliaceae bacterium]